MKTSGLKYLTIYGELKEEVLAGVYPVGELFPAEPVLQQRFHVSRITIRHAVQMLVDEGFLERMHGIGTIVVSQKESLQLQDLLSFSKENKKKITAAKLLNFSPSMAASPYVSSKLDLPKGATVSCIESLRLVDKEIIGFQRVYCPDFIALTEEKIADPNVSLYQVFNELGYRVAKAEETIESVIAGSQLAAYLEIQSDSPLLYVQRTTRDQENRFVEFAEFFYHGDRYQYHVELESPE